MLWTVGAVHTIPASNCTPEGRNAVLVSNLYMTSYVMNSSRGTRLGLFLCDLARVYVAVANVDIL